MAVADENGGGRVFDGEGTVSPVAGAIRFAVPSVRAVQLAPI